MRYQHSSQGPDSPSNRGFFVAAESAVSSCTLNRPGCRILRRAGITPRNDMHVALAEHGPTMPQGAPMQAQGSWRGSSIPCRNLSCRKLFWAVGRRVYCEACLSGGNARQSRVRPRRVHRAASGVRTCHRPRGARRWRSVPTRSAASPTGGKVPWTSAMNESTEPGLGSHGASVG